jgi:hypothetical protein
MNKNMNINEQDIFKYVFSPQTLSEEKREYLRGNEKFKNQILYYKSVKDAINSETSFNLKKKIAAKIPAYTFANVFKLNQVKHENEDSGKVIFAAKTKDETLQIKTKTFIDDENNFLVRVINFAGSTKIYLFTPTNDKVENISIKIFPSSEEYFMNDNDAPLLIDKRIDVESIELRIGD